MVWCARWGEVGVGERVKVCWQDGRHDFELAETSVPRVSVREPGRMSSMAADTLEAIVGTPEAVVLCGSGISAVPPSSVPTWYGLNAAALDGLRCLALEQVLTAPANHEAVLSLHTDDIPIVTFSQVLSDAFAGRGWLDILTVLDGDVTNAVHRALATLVNDHRCHAIITTNFDTLIERACREVGFELPVVLPTHSYAAFAPDASDADLSQPALYKIHGTVSSPDSMVDLLLDKRRGLGPSTHSLIASVCRDRHLVVLGFSGADFAMDPDYLGLLSNAALPARVTWIVRPSSDLNSGARAFLNALSARGVPVAVERHELLDLVGAAGAGGPLPAGDVQRRLDAHVKNWLVHQLTFPPTAALILAELLRLRGQTESAAAVRAEIRDVLTKSDGNGNVLNIAAAPAAWALLGKEEHGGEQALADLRHAEWAMDRLDQFASERKIYWEARSIEEQRLLRAAIRQNAAIVWFRAENMEAAARFLASAEEVLVDVQGPEAARRLGGICYQRAMLDLVQYRLPHAMIAFERSIAFALTCGDVQQEAGSVLMLAMCLRASGDWELAELLDRRATTLGVATTDAGWRSHVENVTLGGSSLLASGMLDDLVSAIAVSPPWDEVSTARAAGDRGRVVDALVANVESDLKEYGGARLGQTLLSLALATGDTSPTSRFVQTVRALCSADLSKVPDHIRFLLRVIELGIDAADVGAIPSTDVIADLQVLGRPFSYRAGVFVPNEFGTGLHMLARAAAQAGVAAFRQREYERAEGLYYLAYRGLWMESEYEDAVRAELYRFDALFALERYEEAAECLDGIREFASRHLPIPYRARHVVFLAWRARQGDPANWPAEAGVLADLVTSIARRSPRHFNRAMLIGAIDIALLKQFDLAKELIGRVDVSTMSDDDAELLAEAVSLVEEGTNVKSA